MPFDYFTKRQTRTSNPSTAVPMAPRPANGLTGQASPFNERPPGQIGAGGTGSVASPPQPQQDQQPFGVGPYAGVSALTLPPAFRYHPLGLFARTPLSESPRASLPGEQPNLTPAPANDMATVRPARRGR